MIEKPNYLTDTLDAIISESKVIVHTSLFYYVKFNKGESVPHCFMVSEDNDEITAVMDEEPFQNYNDKPNEGPFKLLEIRVSQPFVAKGFLATVAHTISNELINNLIISTFSKDYILVRDDAIEQTKTVLKNRGFEIETL